MHQIKEQLSHNKTNRDFFVFSLTSLTDKEFINTLNNDEHLADFARTSIFSVPVREQNIAIALETGSLTTSSKELNVLLKSNDRNKIIEYMNCLDDNTFDKVAKDSSIKKIIKSDSALEHRHSAVSALKASKTNSAYNSPCRIKNHKGLSPCPFSLDDVNLSLSNGGAENGIENTQKEEHPEIKITGDYETDIETLLETPDQQIDDVLNPEKYIQDDVADIIRSIVTSDEFEIRKSTY